MTKNKTYYKALPLNIRKKMRQQQEYELYRTFIREITKFDIDRLRNIFSVNSLKSLLRLRCNVYSR